jgi:hypothetical protein
VSAPCPPPECHAPQTEGWVESIARTGDTVRIDMLLQDGRPAAYCVDADQADWMEIRAGQIINVPASPCQP